MAGPSPLAAMVSLMLRRQMKRDLRGLEPRLGLEVEYEEEEPSIRVGFI